MYATYLKLYIVQSVNTGLTEGLLRIRWFKYSDHGCRTMYRESKTHRAERTFFFLWMLLIAQTNLDLGNYEARWMPQVCWSSLGCSRAVFVVWQVVHHLLHLILLFSSKTILIVIVTITDAVFCSRNAKMIYWTALIDNELRIIKWGIGLRWQ